MNNLFTRLAGWSAYVNAAAFIISIVAVTIYFSVGGFWGTLSDIASVVWALSFIPLAWLLYQMHRPVNAPLSLATAMGGIAAMFIFALLQSLLVLGAVRFEQTVGLVLTLTGVIGLWLLLNGWLARLGQTLPPGLTWVMLVLGISNALGAAGFWIGGYEHPLAAVGLLVGAIAGPVWAIWLGRLLLSERVALA